MGVKTVETAKLLRMAGVCTNGQEENVLMRGVPPGLGAPAAMIKIIFPTARRTSVAGVEWWH